MRMLRVLSVMVVLAGLSFAQTRFPKLTVQNSGTSELLITVSPVNAKVVWAAGAYGFAQSSNYNARRRAAEVLVEGRRFKIARRRETYDDLVRGESLG